VRIIDPLGWLGVSRLPTNYSRRHPDNAQGDVTAATAADRDEDI